MDIIMYSAGIVCLFGGVFLWAQAVDLKLPFSWLGGVAGILAALYWISRGYIINRLDNLTRDVSSFVNQQQSDPKHQQSTQTNKEFWQQFTKKDKKP